eukprot:Rmarinus@m.15792
MTLAKLPPDILQDIFSLLDSPVFLLGAIAKVNNEFRQLATDKSVQDAVLQRFMISHKKNCCDCADVSSMVSSIEEHSSYSPLLQACHIGELDCLLYLTESGIRLSDPDLLFSAAEAGHVRIVHFLLEHGVQYDVPSVVGWTPLFTAARNGHLEIVKCLVERGADVNNDIMWAGTPLYAAAWYGHLEVVKYLVELGANVDQIHENGRSPLHVACERGWLPIVAYLVQKGARVPNLAELARDGHVEIVRYLVENAGADCKTAMRDGETALYRAARHGHVAMVQYLVSKGCDLNAGTLDGESPLCVASCYGHFHVVRVLVEAGADYMRRCRGELTPLELSIHSGNSIGVVQFLSVLQVRHEIRVEIQEEARAAEKEAVMNMSTPGEPNTRRRGPSADKTTSRGVVGVGASASVGTRMVVGVSASASASGSTKINTRERDGRFEEEAAKDAMVVAPGSATDRQRAKWRRGASAVDNDHVGKVVDEMVVAMPAKGSRRG